MTRTAWSAPQPLDEEGREVSPDALTEEFLDDELNIRAGNPALGSGRLTLSSIALERRALSSRAYAVERLSCSDRPTGVAQDQGPILLALWLELEDEDSSALEPRTLAVDIGFRDDGAVHVGCVASDLQVEGADMETVGGLYERLRRFGREHSVDRVVVDERLLRRPVRDALEDATFETVDPVPTAEYATSCATFVTLANEGRLRHVGASRLTDSLKCAHARVYGDSFLWSRRLSADASPIIAATLAAGALVNDRQRVSASGITIH